MTTLVTGATGLVGSRVVAHLVAAGQRVRILRRAASSLDLLGSNSEKVEHAVGDITEADSIEAAFAGVDRVFHIAASLADQSGADRRFLHRVNVAGTANVVNACLHAGVGRLVQTSSMAAFGRGFDHNRAIDETADWEASSSNSDYAWSKHLAELEVFRGIGEGLSAVIVNPSLIFGVGRTTENTRRIIESVRRRRVPAIPSGGTNVVDVEDVAIGHLRAMETGVIGERYFLGSQNLSWKEIIETIASAFNVKPPKRIVRPAVAYAIAVASEAIGLVPGIKPLITRERARYTAATFTYDNSKARAELGMQFRSFRETMTRIAAELSVAG